MSIIIIFLALAIGLALLSLGADMLVRNASKLGLRYKLNSMFIGATIGAIGTSAPEFFISIVASSLDKPGIALGNVLGSNIANLALVMGVGALLSPITIEARTLKLEYAVMLLSTVVCCVLCWCGNKLSRWDGLVLTTSFVIFISVYVHNAINTARQQTQTKHIKRIWLLWMLCVVGLGLLVGGAHIVVESACKIAEFFGLSSSVVGATIVAVGTSLPELATTVVAVLKRENAIAVGNVLGSNIFNLLLVLGTATLIRPLGTTYADNYLLLPLVLFVTVLTFPILRSGRRISRLEGFFLFMYYCLFLYLICSIKFIQS